MANKNFILLGLFAWPIFLFAKHQQIDSIRPDNSDVINPISIYDTVVINKVSLSGYGKTIEFADNPPDDIHFIEKEHNSIWYKFIAKQTGKLTFEITPEDPKDDFDFMLFKKVGGDLPVRLQNKSWKPIRSCISRNDASLKSSTGLCFSDSALFFVHSGIGVSFVQYLQVEKGQVYYLLVDNVKGPRKGHTLSFHYREQDPSALYIGKMLPFDEIYFESEDFKFKPGSEKSLDSLLFFLNKHSTICVQVLGHVNSKGDIHPHRYDAQTLSELRAKAICDYLIGRGIDARRLCWLGMADRHKRIPNPVTSSDYRKNMRADVRVYSLYLIGQPISID